MDYRQIPKIELHLHLDCSLSYKVVQQLNPAISYEAYRESFIAPPKCTDLADYISRAVKGYELMQTAGQLRLVTLDLFEQLQADHVIYAEIRFAPLLHIAGGLTPHEVVQAVNDAVEEGIRTTGIQAGIIVCTLRHHTEEQSMITVKLAEAFRGTHVVGFDIAGDEAGYPITSHLRAFAYAGEHSIPCTAHAGEARGADSVWETLEHFHPRRIGHGVRSAEDPALLAHLKKENIHLEVCPTSNIQVNVFDTIDQHPADRIYQAGVSMSINTDCRTISDTNLCREYGVMQEHFNWTIHHFLQCNLEAVAHCFAGEAVKAELRNRIMAAYAALPVSPR